MTTTAAPPPAPPSRSRRVWAIVLVLVVVAIGVGTWLAVTRGMRRSNLYEHAVTALAAGNRATAEEMLRELLDINPSHPSGRGKLIEMLLADQRFDEARDVAKEWVALEDQGDLGWPYLIEVELRQAHLGEAERLAREIITEQPELSLLTIVRVRDALGTPRDRWEAQKAATHIATITESPARKTLMLIFAAETTLDLAPDLPPGERAATTQIARRALAEALHTLDTAAPVGGETDEARQLRARILLLSTDSWERESGEKTVRKIIETDPNDFEAHAALAASYAAQEDWPKAAAKVADLAGPDRPYLIWLRAVRRLAARAPAEVVLPLLDASPRPDDPLFVLLRAEVLFRGDEAARTQATDLLVELSKREDIDRRILVSVFRLLLSRGQEKIALSVLERIPDDELEAAERALLGSGSEGGAGSARAAQLLQGLAGRVTSLRESITVLSILQRSDDGTVAAYLEAPITGEGDDAARKHLMRAAAAAMIARRTEPGPRQATLLRAAKGDIEAVPATAEKTTLADALWASLDIREFELAGRNLGRALAKEGQPYALSLRVLAMARSSAEDDARTLVAQGVRAAADDSEAQTYLRAVSDAIESPPKENWESLRAALHDAAKEPGSQTPALILGIQLANADNDLDGSRRLAEELVAARPDLEYGRALLGDHLIRAKDFTALAKLHEANTGKDLDATRQYALALFETGELEPAFAVAQKAVTDHGARSDEPHLLLASLRIRNRQPIPALGTLAAAPSTPRVLLLRAQLLTERKEFWAAESLYSGLLARQDESGNRSAWFGMSSVLSQQNRHQELVEMLTSALDRPAGELPNALRSDLLALRGSAYESLIDFGAALRDYDAAIALNPESVVALNNAAWLILQIATERVDEAVNYIEHALALQSDTRDPSILDTAAMVYLASRRPEEALVLIDEALEQARKSNYLVDRAKVLIELGRNEEAEKQLTEVIGEFGASTDALTATNLLRRLRGR